MDTKTDLAKYIGIRMLTALEDKNWSQSELSRQLGTDRSAVSRWCSGSTNIGIKTLEEVAVLLDKPVEYFLPTTIEGIDELPPSFRLLIRRLQSLPPGQQKEKLLSAYLMTVGR